MEDGEVGQGPAESVTDFALPVFPQAETGVARKVPPTYPELNCKRIIELSELPYTICVFNGMVQRKEAVGR